jgi:hypothetical protein
LPARPLRADGSYSHFRLVNGDRRCHTVGIRLQKLVWTAANIIF